MRSMSGTTTSKRKSRERRRQLLEQRVLRPAPVRRPSPADILPARGQLPGGGIAKIHLEQFVQLGATSGGFHGNEKLDPAAKVARPHVRRADVVVRVAGIAEVERPR